MTTLGFAASAGGNQFVNALRSDTVAFVDTFDLREAVDLAVLSIVPSSRVLQIGHDDGSYARKLAARACRLWAMDNGCPTDSVNMWCEAVSAGELPSIDLGSLLDTVRVDAVLFLNSLERLGEPAVALHGVAPFLAPGGRFVFGNVRGSDLSTLRSFLHDVGARIFEVLPVVGASDVEVTGRADQLDQCVVIAGMSASTELEILPTLASASIERLRSIQRDLNSVREQEREARLQAAHYRDEVGQLRAALEEARQWHRQAADEALRAQDRVRHLDADLHQSRKQLDAVSSELSRCQVHLRFLRDDVIVKDAYLATLREEASRHQQEMADCQAAYRDESAHRHRLAEELHAVNDRLNEQITSHAAAVDRGVELSCLNDELRQRLDETQHELHRVHVAVATTLAQPRFAIADRLNAWARRLRFVHTPLKRAWLARHPL